MNSELQPWQSQPNIFEQLLQSASTSSNSNRNNNHPSTSSNIMDYGILYTNSGSLSNPSSRTTPRSSHPHVDHCFHEAPSGLPPLVSSETVALRKEYECLAESERKEEYRTRVVERLMELCVDDALEAKTAVGMEIAQGVDFLRLLDSSHPKLAEFEEISDNSREGVAKLIDGLRLVERAQNRLRYILFNEGASSAK
ncbi:hypothetical protein K2173_003594 [Erythroxylum novogranatense]|uniref:Uncharacterized protein n=1 Tax=Erythroxylum novogranatense TaxID=1862640 RepID=A0AAV8TAF1_9ROSI|nr:hypothetical protein K2173_003594 [Erythroxylum novogranatense]